MGNLHKLFAVGVIALASTPRAFATAELKLSDGAGHSVTIPASACGAGCQIATATGSIGDWNINTTTGTSTPGSSPIMDIDTIDHHNASSAPTTLTIEWSDNGLTPAAPGFEMNIGGTIGAQGTVTASLYGGTSDTEFDLSNQIGTTMTFTSLPITFSASQSAYLAGLSPNPYALTEVATITFGKSTGQASFDFSVDTVPEPAAVLLLGTVILILVSVARRRVGRRGV